MVQVASQDELIGRPRLWKLVVFELLLVTEYWSGRVANLSSDNVSRLFFHRQIYKPARLLKVVIIMEGKGRSRVSFTQQRMLAEVSWLEDDSLSFVCTMAEGKLGN